LIGTKVTEEEKYLFVKLTKKYNLSEAGLLRMVIHALLEDEDVLM